MKGKTIAIAMVVVTIVTVAAIYFLVMATFKHDQPDENTLMESPSVIELAESTERSL
ncbi:hypothetical protein [Sporosarcina aquimarina]|uniref:Uncharacterized protein n=1 Tax=Sporosarcina aquimarina TaxID=114975 RepID=A0ABU4FZC6_9BACL|nr:hypothetical protein [Sporosarcina aquimarina]MDW0110076.1 hypothetical protein [Sporosarcina aquimarina]